MSHSPEAAAPSPRLAIVSCMKNEGPDLVEWLCFHRHIGVSRFIIYDNLSTDSTRRILWEVPFKDEIEIRTATSDWPQHEAFKDSLVRDRDALDWAAFVDGDELIVPLGERPLLDKLAELDASGVRGLGIHWRIFGSSGHQTRPAGLVAESFTRRAADTLSTNRHIKSVIKMSAAVKMDTSHYFLMDGPYLLEDGAAPEEGFKGKVSGDFTYRDFAIHHYIVKSREQCLQKFIRGDTKPKPRPPAYWDTYDRNEVEDDRAAQVIAPIREQVLELREQIGRD